MKRAAVHLIVFLAGIGAGVLFLESRSPVQAGTRPEKPWSGDTNGDGDISITDAVYLLNYLFLGGEPPSPAECPEPEPRPGLSGAGTVILVRHGEREPGQCEALLRPEGEERARELARVLAETSIDALVASDCIRTRLTLEPLRDALKAEGKELEIAEIALEADVKRYIEQLPAGSTVVVAHHSFTLHDIMIELGLPASVRTIPTSYDNLFVIERRAGEAPRLVHLKYPPFLD